jgi:ATP-dependent helicase Lhr and Lhr-like helicase
VNPHALKNNLLRTWGAFFGRHGNFTAAQSVAIPLLLAGENVMLSAPTATGKTEAALAPLIERYLPPARATPQLTIVYVLPTRALINDLWARLAVPFESLRISVAVKTRDFDNFAPAQPADVLLTTPESLDALFASHALVLSGVQAVILDELHIFDGTVRGDQLRVLLNRLRQVRAYAFKMGDAPGAAVQYVALSATLGQPSEVVARYFPDARVVQLSGSREVDIESIALDADSPAALLDYLRAFGQRGWRKALVFCNTRAEVEGYATAVRAAHSLFGDAVYVHYSNLERERRREIEQQFGQAETAICFTSSTLELGIDIGNIDIVILIGAPGSAESFTQRVGRSNRRQLKTRAACFYRTPLERIMFEALPTTALRSPTSFFLPSVAIQQIFSLLKQSPTAALRFNPLCALFEGLLSALDIRALLGQLQALGYLKNSRMGEWRAGERLNQLVDMQAAEQTPLSLYSNIQTSIDQMKIRDQHTQRVVASIDRQWLQRESLTLEGRSLNVTWYDGDALWVSAARGVQPSERVHYRSVRQILSYELAQQLPLQLGLSAHTAPLIQDEEGWLCFHWLGDLYGHALLDLVRYTLSAEDTPQPGLCLRLPDEPRVLPSYTPEQVTRYIRDHYLRYETLLSLGAYHHLLPVELRRRAVIEQFNVARFVQAVAQLHIERAPDTLTDALHAYLH